MVKLTKNGRLREKTLAEVERAKQSTFDSLPASNSNKPAKAVKPAQEKRISITEITHTVREDELALKIGFRLYPSKAYFSKLRSELYFKGEKLEGACIAIPQSPLATDDFEFMSVLDMRGIGAGSYTVRAELFEQWTTGEILTSASKEIMLEYVPCSRQERLVKVPTVKSVAGADLSIILSKEKDIISGLEQDAKKELAAKRDRW